MKHHSFPILTADEAAALIQNGQTVGFSAFTPAGAAKAVPVALARRAKAEHAAGPPLQSGRADGSLDRPDHRWCAGRSRRHQLPHTLSAGQALRAMINDGKVTFFDMHLSTVAAERPLWVLWRNPLGGSRGM